MSVKNLKKNVKISMRVNDKIKEKILKKHKTMQDFFDQCCDEKFNVSEAKVTVKRK